MSKKDLNKFVEENSENLGNYILKVTGIINHQINPYFMSKCGEYLYNNLILKHNLTNKITKILTAPVSGIIPSYVLSDKLNVPMIYARTKIPITLDKNNIHESAFYSHTKKKSYKLYVSNEYLNENDNVLIVDDFLATGITFIGLIKLCQKAKANIVGAGFVVEKSMENGVNNVCKYTENNGIPSFPIVSCVKITKMDGNKGGKVVFSKM